MQVALQDRLVAAACALFGTASLDLLGACAGKPAAQAVATPPSATEDYPSDAGLVSGRRPSAGLADGSPVSETPQPDARSASARASGHCAADMVLVDGEFCTELETHCLKSWYAEANKKTICERFEEPTRCIGQRLKKRYCMDRYEFPNKKGERPEVWNNFYQAQVKCADLGKRMCTESEWTMACEGPKFRPYPYGYVRDSKKCNGDRTYRFPNKKKLWDRDPVESERLWQGVVSGSQPECVSEFGVYDLPGNADELAASEGPTHYDNVTTGGPWYYGVRNQCRPKIRTHDEAFAYYYLSFRCCAEPDGKPTDPRSPKQIKRGWKWEKVKRMAAISLSLKPR